MDELDSIESNDQKSSNYRFEIVDLILITVGFALAFSANQQGSLQNFPILITMYVIQSGITLGLCFVSLRRVFRFPSDYLWQPGCILLIKMSALILLYLVGRLIDRFTVPSDEVIDLEQPLSVEAQIYLWSEVARHAGAILVLIFGLIKVRLVRWRVFFSLLIIF